MSTQSQLVPVLREGIDIVKIFTYKTIKEYFNNHFENIAQGDCNKLSGIILNIIFGTPNTNEEIKKTQGQYNDEIQQVINELPGILGDFCNTITDALRIQILCDGYNNIDSTPILEQAEQLKILQKDRELPLPNTFIVSVRELGAENQLLAPMQ
jgi:hypothetical protein